MVLWLALVTSLSYEQALEKATIERKPLMVVVTAKWCGSCQVMKRDTLLPMADDLKNCVVVYVDYDERPDIAKKIMVGDEIPQVAVYHRQKRFGLVGKQDKGRIRELLKRVFK